MLKKLANFIHNMVLRGAKEARIMRSTRDNLKLFDDLARMATGALGSLGQVRQQVKALVKERVEQAMEEMDVVPRREFDRVEALAQRARMRQEELEKRLATLEKMMKTGKKPATGKTSAKRKKK